MKFNKILKQIKEQEDKFLFTFSDISNPKQLLDWMSRNIQYGYFGKDGKIYLGDVDSEKLFENYLLMSPKEVLKYKVGLCWDQVNLEREWFEAHNFEYESFYIKLVIKANEIEPSHTFLKYTDVNGKHYIFENSFYSLRGISELDNFSNYLNKMINKMIENEGVKTTLSNNDIFFTNLKKEYPPVGSSVTNFMSFCENFPNIWNTFN